GVATLNFTVGFGLFDWIEIGAVLPFILINEGTWNGRELDDNSIGDLLFQVKARFMKNDDFGCFCLGMVAEIGVPIGSEEDFLGNGSVFGRVSLIADFKISIVTIAANVGAVLRDENVTLNINQTHEFEARMGVDVEVVDGLLHLL